MPLHVDGTPLTSRQWGTPSDLQPDEIGIGKAQCNQLPEQARNDFYARVAVSVYVENLKLEDWKNLRPQEHHNHLGRLCLNEQENAWDMLDPWEQRYGYKYLSTPLELKYWNSLTSEAKQYNIWYLSEEQRAKLYIISSEEIKVPAFQSSEISMDRKRLYQLNKPEQDDFYKRVAESIYSE